MAKPIRPRGTRRQSRNKIPAHRDQLDRLNALPPELSAHSGVVTIICRKLLPRFKKAGSWYDINDLYGIAALHLWKQREAIRLSYDSSRGKISTFVGTVVRNALLNELNRKKGKDVDSLFQSNEVDEHWKDEPRHGSVPPLMREIYHRAKSKLHTEEQVFLSHLEGSGNRYQAYLACKGITPEEVAKKGETERYKKRSQAYYDNLLKHLQSVIKIH